MCVYMQILGAWAVALRRNQLVVLLDRLRGHWEVMGALESNEGVRLGPTQLEGSI